MLIQRYVFLLAAVLLSVSATALVNGQQETKRAAVFTPKLRILDLPVIADESSPPQCENCIDGKCEKCLADNAAVAVVIPDTKKPLLRSTHKQTSTFAPNIDGQPATLATFRIVENGQLVACLHPPNAGNQADSARRGFVQIYSPDLELVKQIGLPFLPDAIDVDSSGNLFVGGESQISRLTKDGEIVASAPSPNTEGKDLEQLKADLVLQTEQQQNQAREVYKKQIARIQEQVDKIELIEEDKRSKADLARLKTYHSQLQTYQRLSEGRINVGEAVIESRLKSQFKISSIALTANDVFVATSAPSGSGYVVYRMDHDLKNPECVLKNLRGCCGQMDVDASPDKIYVAENTKYRVGVYDRDGKELAGMGEKVNKDNQGFGGCCNPMNVLCCPDGTVLTSESTTGKIKKFNSDGELVGYVGSAKIGSGCANVSFGYDSIRDRYYVQHKAENTICVLNRDDSPGELESEPKLENGELDEAVSDDGEDSVVGVGLQLKENEDGTIVVTGTIPGSPASEKKLLQTDDVLIAVGEGERAMVEIKGKTLEEVVNLIRGGEYSTVRLKLQSADGKHTRRMSLMRRRMSLVEGQWQVK